MSSIRQAVGLTRRRWMANSAAMILSGSSWGFTRQTQESHDADFQEQEHQGLALIRERALGAGLPELQVYEGQRYVALGTASDDFSIGALRLCEGLADDFMDHFKSRKFAIDAPSTRLTMVSLADHGEFVRFLGTEQPRDVTGIFEIEPNYLVLYDGRSGSPAGAQAERANSITLFHEATHQLSFNTGLLDPSLDLPLAIIEGLAMYGEVRRPNGRTRIGSVNQERLAVLLRELSRGGDFLPLPDLISQDNLFAQESTVQLAYAQSWLLVYSLMRDRNGLERFRSYLETLNSPKMTRSRLEHAEESFGDLEQLESGLKRALVRFSQKR